MLYFHAAYDPDCVIALPIAWAVLLTLKGGGSRGHVANVGIPIGSHACKPKRPDLAKPPRLKALPTNAGEVHGLRENAQTSRALR